MKKISPIIDGIQNYLNSIRASESELPTLDSTSPNYDFQSYLECCASLNVIPKITKFVRYQTLYRNYLK